jgi:hypothetical protein
MQIVADELEEKGKAARKAARELAKTTGHVKNQDADRRGRTGRKGQGGAQGGARAC